MHFTSETRIDDILVEREFTFDGISGVLWTPASASHPSPLILMGQPGGFSMRRMLPRLRARARSSAEQGLAAVAIEQPGAGDRPPVPGAAQARADLRRAIEAGEQPAEEVIDRVILPLVERAVPEWQRALDELLTLPEIGDRAAFSGGVISIGIRLAAIDPRIVAAGLFAGSYVPRTILDEARRVTIPVHVLLQWDDEGNDRQRALELFDALGSTEKALHANMGGHTGVPPHAGEDAGRFFVRHLWDSRR
ncbi:alpha/beta hydrolase [Microbacterium sp. NPDC058345]|uniref:alpha/beta hydrolase n=1 Tax=Microbacterium sp. NPDC058345 TaxID=3346455 RepID=UPI0036630A8A